MSCRCFPDSVLNSYILLNAWLFSTRTAHWTFSFLGFRSKNTRAAFSLALEVLAIYLFFPLK